MIPQHGDYTSTDAAVFSSLLARASAAVNASASSANDGLRHDPAAQLRNSGTGKNRNLSSIITRIQDDGPALALADDEVHLSTDKIPGSGLDNKLAPRSAAAPAVNRTAGLQHASGERSRASAEIATVRGLKREAAGTNKKGATQLVALLALVAAGVVCFSAYTMIDRADEIILALRQQGEGMRAGQESQNQTDILPLVSSLNEEMKALKNEFQAIRNDYRDSENRLSMKIPDDLADQLMKLSAVEGNGNELQNNLEHIRHDMADMKQVISSVRTGLPPVSAATRADSGDWIVNLASLSSRDKAQQAVTQLQESGVAPVIQETVVNGEIVYRLSVDGFFSRDDATLFINKARKELGFEGGWIRRS